MKKFMNILRGLSGNNRGSAIVVVLISMACVALMGASVLFTSYTAFSMRATERQAVNDFYNAETAMAEIRAGMQTTVSDAIAVAYKSVLVTYSESTDIKYRFEQEFKAALEDSFLTTDAAGNLVYDPAQLQRYVVTPVGGGSVKVGVDAADGSGIKKEPVAKDGDCYVLKNVRVTYTAPSNEVTTITTDLVIDMPDFAYTSSAASITGLPQHALIAKEKLVQEIGSSDIDISGSAYVGGMDLKNTNNSKLTIENGTMVCAGTANIGGLGGSSGSRLVTGSDVKFWAGRIKVNGNSDVSLNGETRVLDDLELAGTGAEAALKGSYYGFGNGTAPNLSSAILVNGRNSRLDISGLNRLMLAGRAYISDSLYASPDENPNNAHVGGADPVGMIESLTVRVNQQMYLIDPADLEKDPDGSGNYVAVDENPFFITTEDTSKLRFRLKNGNDRGFGVTHRIYNFPGGKIVYCFMDFDDPSVANEYFEQRFSQNSGQIASYLGNNSNLNAAGTGSQGYIIRGKDGNYTFRRATDASFDCEGMLSTFNQLKTTLIDYNTRPNADNPYNYIVKADLVAGVSGADYFKSADNKTLGVVTAGDYTIDGSHPDLRLVIAGGNVEIQTAYTGLVISGKNIVISGNNADITADDKGVINAFGAVNADSETLGSYLRNGGTNNYGQDISGQADGWHLNSLITYKNWTKN